MRRKMFVFLAFFSLTMGCATMKSNRGGSKKCAANQDQSLVLSTGSVKCAVDVNNFPVVESYPIVSSKEMNIYEVNDAGCRTGKILSSHGTETVTRDPVTECQGLLMKDKDGELVLKCVYGDKVVCQMRKEKDGKISWVTGYNSTMSMLFVGASKQTKDDNWTLNQNTSMAGIGFSLTDLQGNLHKVLFKGREFSDWNFNWDPGKN